MHFDSKGHNGNEWTLQTGGSGMTGSCDTNESFDNRSHRSSKAIFIDLNQLFKIIDVLSCT